MLQVVFTDDIVAGGDSSVEDGHQGETVFYMEPSSVAESVVVSGEGEVYPQVVYQQY